MAIEPDVLGREWPCQATLRAVAVPLRAVREDCVLDNYAAARNVALARQFAYNRQEPRSMPPCSDYPRGRDQCLLSAHKGCASRRQRSSVHALFGQHAVPGLPVKLDLSAARRCLVAGNIQLKSYCFVQPRHESHAFHA